MHPLLSVSLYEEASFNLLILTVSSSNSCCCWLIASFFLFRTDVLPSVVQLLRVQGLFREAVLALWAADLADLKLGRALIRAIQARRLLAPVADERVLLHFQDGCPALGVSFFMRAGPLPRGRPRLVGC